MYAISILFLFFLRSKKWLRKEKRSIKSLYKSYVYNIKRILFTKGSIPVLLTYTSLFSLSKSLIVFNLNDENRTKQRAKYYSKKSWNNMIMDLFQHFVCLMKTLKGSQGMRGRVGPSLFNDFPPSFCCSTLFLFMFITNSINEIWTKCPSITLWFGGCNIK